MAEVVLAGCAPVPLACYLKALGVFRLVAEQKDKSARGYWRDDAFVLDTALTKEELVRFFLDDYRPSPIVSPWNGGSGFFPKDNKLGLEPLGSSAAMRFSDYKETIDTAKAILKLNGIIEKPRGVQKDEIRRQLRSKLNDHALLWYDAAILLARSDFLAPPLLGSGGNDGRTDFSNNFMCRLTDLFDTSNGHALMNAKQALETTLYGRPTNSLVRESKAEINGSRKGKLFAIGQFDPGASGGANATVGFERQTQINPWDYVLLMEGTLLFAASAARRLESADSAAVSYPFTVNSTNTDGAGGSLADENRKSKGKIVGNLFEIWMPLWERTASLAEIRAVLSEGRATLGRRSVEDGLDFARAVAVLGVNRGIGAFERYAFLQRRGDAISATPKGRIRVQPHPRTRLLSDLDAGDWLARLRRYARELDGQSKGFVAPRQAQLLALRLDGAIFAMAQDASAGVVQRVLIAVGEAATYLVSSPKARDPKEGRQKPPRRLRPAWFRDADDGSPEFRIAAALAGLGRAPARPGEAPDEEPDVDSPTEDGVAAEQDETLEDDVDSEEGATPEEEPHGRATPPPLRAHLAPLDEKSWYRRFREWSDKGPLTVWGLGTLQRNLAAVVERRLLFAAQHSLNGGPFDGRAPADLTSVLAFLAGDTDDARIAALAQGLAWADAPNSIFTQAARPRPLPLAYALLKPLFAPIEHVRTVEGVPRDIRLPFPPGLVARLRAGDIGAAVTLACRRARASGLPLTFELGRKDAANIDGPRLLAALLIPIRQIDLGHVMARAYPALFDDTKAPQENPANAA